MRLQAEALFGGGGAFGEAQAVELFARADRAAALVSRGDLACVLVVCAVPLELIAVRLGAAVGFSLPVQPVTVVAGADCRALWLTPRSWLLQCRHADEIATARRVNDAFPDNLARATPYSDALCWFQLAGSAAGSLLAEGGWVSLEPGGLAVGRIKRALFAALPAMILREQEDTWLLGVERSRAAYLVDWFRGTWNRSLQLPQ
jgi:heterotetrameric sarcosine oxidase gamma subunit